MAIITDFFAARPDELIAAFPGWMQVGLKNRPWKNPLTGDVHMTWAPLVEGPKTPSSRAGSTSLLTRLFKKARPAERADVGKKRYSQIFPTFQSKGVDIVKLCTLEMLLSACTFNDAIARYDKPALISPNDGEEGLYAASDSLVQALSSLTESQLVEVGRRWLETDELRKEHWSPSDANSVLTSLRSLARESKRLSKALYLYWSL
ncbi:MAG TPA: hypothetical protein VEI74_05615 [Candidatus Methylomirabilis sp.]|nr:hypothetical protein [Candidatus Methylomirabilis sp.]